MRALIDKWGSRKLAVTAIAGAAVAVAGPDLLTWPVAAVACCYLLAQGYADGKAAE